MRSDSETSLEDGSPSIIDFPLIDLPLPRTDISLDGTGWPDIISPTFPGARKEPQRISTSCMAHYLEVYQTRGYVVWPVADTEILTARLLTNPEDMEAYGLAAAICAATVSQFRIDAEPGSPVEGHYRVSSALFEKEAKRAREAFDHMEHATLWSLLSSFFLHVYSANVGRMAASTILLGEAITKAHMIGLHTVDLYTPMNFEQQQHHLRIYWLLFITERAHSIQHDVPTMLKRAPDLPSMENVNDGTVSPAFIQLCRLFNILDVTITADPTTARKALTLAQQQLSDDDDSRNLQNELERADISMTQQWMRIFLWQHALGVTSLRSSYEDDEFSFSFPAKVAQNVLGHLTTIQKANLEAHGPGMESKLFDIANSLADVMICVPSINHESHFGIGPRDLIHHLSTLLASFRGGNPAVLNILQDKLTSLGLAVSSPRRLTDLSPSSDEGDASGDTPRSITWSDSSIYTPITPTLDFPSGTTAMDTSL